MDQGGSPSYKSLERKAISKNIITRSTKLESSQQGASPYRFVIAWEHPHSLLEGYDGPFSYVDILEQEKKDKAKHH